MATEKACLMISADRPIPGREGEAVNLWLETGGFLEAQQAAGFFARWDGFWLTPHGGRINSSFIVYGDRAKLDEWRRTDAFEAWVFRATNCLGDVAVVPGVHYGAAKETLERRAKALTAK